MNKENWTQAHRNIHNSIKALEKKTEIKSKEIDDFISEKNKEINQLERQIKFLCKQCDHIDDGGPFLATCSVCGWVDPINFG